MPEPEDEVERVIAACVERKPNSNLAADRRLSFCRILPQRSAPHTPPVVRQRLSAL
jgi:hypothetical protein